ncbi:MAG: hypothetical protein CL421_08260 [Acidimicrobiaceae bacterium]|nr:hypothetical protein [Acidimicrobiaceae bacterium]|tara:strand:+ start:1875 stop:2909 length:1035 start_codon:yes stop_codon:yes gene_type:complete
MREGTIYPWLVLEKLSQQFELCGVYEDSTVTVLSDEFSETNFKLTVLMALERVGCRTISLTLPLTNKHSFAEVLNYQSTSLALSKSDLVIDLTKQISDEDMNLYPLSETQVLTIRPSLLENLENFSTSEGVLKRANKIDSFLDDGGYLSISDSSGTQINFDISNSVRKSLIGFPIEKGSRAKWPSGSVELFPDISDLNAVMIIMPGDLLLEAAHVVKSPVRLEIEKGNIVEIQGESSDASLIKSQLEYHESPENAYSFRSVCLGLCLNPESALQGPFNPLKIKHAIGGFNAGWVTVTTGSEEESVLSVTMTKSTVTIGNIQIFSNGELSTNLAPDIYEKTTLEY